MTDDLVLIFVRVIHKQPQNAFKHFIVLERKIFRDQHNDSSCKAFKTK